MSYQKATPAELKSRLANRPLVIGLTGTIGSGKSSVAAILGRRSSVYLVDADSLARQVVAPETPTLAQVVSYFGAPILQNDGALDRRKLGQIVFADPAKRKGLEAILHPAIREVWQSTLTKLKQEIHARGEAQGSLIVYEVPLLFESSYDYPELDAVVVVSASREECLRRIVSRNRISMAEAEARMDTQIPSHLKERSADFVLNNDGEPNSLAPQVETLYATLLPPQ